jgi:hypothetical protein
MRVKRGTGWRAAQACAATCALLLVAPPAAGKKPEHIAKEASLGAGSALATMVWTPLKLAHAAVGGIAGGICFLVTGGDTEVWKRVASRAFTGDYVITPQHLQGKKKLRFSGGGGDDKGKGKGDGK